MDKTADPLKISTIMENQDQPLIPIRAYKNKLTGGFWFESTRVQVQLLLKTKSPFIHQNGFDETHY